MELNKISSSKKHGDFVTVGAILGITPDNARYAFTNEKALRHNQVKQTLEAIIKGREHLIDGDNG